MKLNMYIFKLFNPPIIFLFLIVKLVLPHFSRMVGKIGSWVKWRVIKNYMKINISTHYILLFT